jgi:hypothetical protein
MLWRCEVPSVARSTDGSIARLLSRLPRALIGSKRDKKQLVAEVAEYLRAQGFGPKGYTETIGVPTYSILDPKAFRDNDVGDAVKILDRLSWQGVRMQDPYWAALAYAGSIVAQEQKPLPARLRRYLAKGPLTPRGRRPNAGNHRDEFISFAVTLACVLGELKPTRSREAKNDDRAPSGASIVEEALREIGGVKLSEIRIAAIWSGPY